MKVVFIGGGTGSYMVLTAIKHLSNIEVTSIVPISDSGGSAKLERDEFGILPSSDVRKVLLALADGTDEALALLREMMSYRFCSGGGSLEGCTLGNLMIAALTNMRGSQQQAIRDLQILLNCRGTVLPVALDASQLVIRYEDGHSIVGEHYLDLHPEMFPGDGTQRVVGAELIPPVNANGEAIEAIQEADFIVLPPGDLYGSLLANFLVKGVSEAISKSSAKLICVLNLMTKYGQTYGLSAKGHVEVIELALQKSVSKILINSTQIPDNVLSRYQSEKALPVEDDFGSDMIVMRADLLSPYLVDEEAGDTLNRSLIRHDSLKVANSLERVMNSLL